MNEKSALIVGATGLIGGELLTLLLADDTYNQVIVLSRRPIAIDHKKLAMKIIDFNQLREVKLQKVDDLFCVLGTTMKNAGSQEAFYRVDYEYPIETAKLALQHEAKRCFIVTAMGAHAQSKIFYNKVKGEVEDAISRLAFQSIFIVRPSLLLGKRKERRNGELVGQFLAKVLAFLFVGNLKRYKAIEGKVVAKALLVLSKSNALGINIYSSNQIKEIADTKK